MGACGKGGRLLSGMYYGHVGHMGEIDRGTLAEKVTNVRRW